jgi:hypothetical protein
MYCRNCGKELIGVPYYCMNCGARPLAGTAFCPSCANTTTPLSEICVKCGLKLVQSQTAPQIKPARSKSTAILLAVFLQFGTWAYTYKHDRWKFWIGLAIWIFMIMLLAAQIGPAGWLMALGVWIWAIVDVARRPDEWYQEQWKK